jgi:hypothetical protein
MSADRMKHLGRIRDALDNNNFEDEVDIIDRMIAEEAASVRTPKKRRVSRAACSVDAGAVALHRPSAGNRYKFRGSGNPTSDRMRGIVGSGLQAASSLIALIHVLRHAWGVGLALGLVVVAAVAIPATAGSFEVRLVAASVLGLIVGLTIRKTREWADDDVAV